MKKLEDIPKKEIFNVPEGYFDKLPGVIQSRVAARQQEGIPVYRYALRYALPVVVILVAAIFWLNQPDEGSTSEKLLASIDTQDLVAYLNESDMTTEELLENASLDVIDANEIEGAVYDLNFQDEDLDILVEEFDT